MFRLRLLNSLAAELAQPPYCASWLLKYIAGYMTKVNRPNKHLVYLVFSSLQRETRKCSVLNQAYAIEPRSGRP